jgi:hypothetical protein
MVNLEGEKQGPITSADVKQTIRKILSDQDNHLRYLWDETTREEKLVLASLSMYPQADSEQVSRAKITERLNRSNLSEDIINQALERLLMRDLVRMQSNEEQSSILDSRQETEMPTTGKDYLYCISLDLFRQWVAKKHPLGTLFP